MKEVFILYCGDAWLSRRSMVCMGVFSCLDKAVDAALEEIKKTDSERYEECHDDLVNYLQTHGLEENWYINIVELDKFEEI